jgi:hypothetical protein
MVQESMAPAVIDFTSSEAASEVASNGAKTSAGTSVSLSRGEDSNTITGDDSVTQANMKVEDSDNDTVDDVAVDGSLYEEILDEVEAFAYSTDGRVSSACAIISVAAIDF